MKLEVAGTFQRSHLREPNVVDLAASRPVEIAMGAMKEPLMLLRRSLVDALDELREYSSTFLLAAAAIQQSIDSTAILGDIGFIADWTNDRRQAFLAGFGESLAESLRLSDPRPVRGYLAMMSQATGAPSTSKTVTGELSETALEAVAGRIGLRDDT
jgi:hypothetical protein